MDIRTTWKGFVGRLESLFEELPDHRHQDQYMASRKAGLGLARSDRVVEEIARGYEVSLKAQDAPKRGVPRSSADDLAPSEIVLQEMEAATLAIPIYLAEAKSGAVKQGSRDALCSGLKCVLGSVKEVFHLSEYGKAAIEVLKEAVELFSGK